MNDPTEPSEPLAAFLGDSFTMGAGASSAEDAWTTVVSEHQGWVQDNFGEGGTGYATAGRVPGNQPYDQRVAAVVAAKPSVVIVSGGLNDIADATDAEFVAAVRATYDGLRAALPDVPIIAVSPFYDADPPPPRLAAEAAEIKAAAANVHAIYLDVGDPLEGHPSDISADGVHPNDAGHLLLATAVDDALAGR